MDIQSCTVINNPPRSYPKVKAWESVEPVLELGDRVTISYYVEPVKATVKDISDNGQLIWLTDLPVATPTGTLSCSVAYVQKIERNGQTWVRP